MKQPRISAAVRQRVMSEYYRERARKAGSTNSPNKIRAAHQASMLTGRRLATLAQDHPELAPDINAYLMSVEQERVLKRRALIEKIEKITQKI